MSDPQNTKQGIGEEICEALSKSVNEIVNSEIEAARARFNVAIREEAAKLAIHLSRIFDVNTYRVNITIEAYTKDNKP